MEEDKQILKVIVEDQLKQAYLDYSMSVIIGRALPDVRDGLKPVHRRILFAMHELGLMHNKAFSKCARIVGTVLGDYHPHGDSSVYDALVRMAQDFNLRYPLIHGQGNFGSIDGFSAAAYRYTEAKLAKISQELLADIEKETVEFVPNFDNRLKEPLVLPAKLPNLLINGSSGIAVGMATNIPPHNINEICDALIFLVDNLEGNDSDLYQFVKGPDFPTGGIILGTNGIKSAYKTGKGKLIVRAKAELENKKIIITEIPYQVNKSMLIEKIADLVKEKIIEGISDIRDESDRHGLTIVIELKNSANGEVILNQLYKHSDLQVTFGVNMLALINGEPKVLSLKDILLEFIKHRKEIIVKRTKYDLKQAEERDHILQGLLIALQNIDAVVALIKKSKDVKEAREGLITNYILTEVQANAILDMKLSKLASLEHQKIIEEHNGLLIFIEECKKILNSEERIRAIIKDELIDLKNNYGDERKTNIIEDPGEIETEDLIDQEKVVITVTHSGYAKRLPLDTYKSQRRGGKGIIGTTTKDDEDFIEHLFITNSHSYLLLFTDKGVVHWVKAYQIPESGRYAKGTALINIVKFGEKEKLASLVAISEFKEDNYLVMATKNGIIKKTSLMEYSRPRQGGIIGINLRENDELINVELTDGTKQLIMATKDGRAVRFMEKDVSVVGRNSIGVRGINVKNSEVIGMEVVNAPYLLTVTEKGYGKRSEVNDYRLINRGGSGVTNIKITEKNGIVVGIKIVDEKDEIMLISNSGVVIRMPVTGISVIGRNTQGVRLMNLDNEIVSNVVRIIGEDEIENERKEFIPSAEVVVDNLDANEIVEDSKITDDEVKEFLDKNESDKQ